MMLILSQCRLKVKKLLSSDASSDYAILEDAKCRRASFSSFDYLSHPIRILNTSVLLVTAKQAVY